MPSTALQPPCGAALYSACRQRPRSSWRTRQTSAQLSIFENGFCAERPQTLARTSAVCVHQVEKYFRAAKFRLRGNHWLMSALATSARHVRTVALLVLYQGRYPMRMRALFWLNIVALFLLWLLVGPDIYGQTYGWWIDAKTSGPAHSPLILILLVIPLLALGVLVANIRAIFSSETRPRTKAFCGLSATVLILGIVVFFSLPYDTLSSLTVA